MESESHDNNGGSGFSRKSIDETELMEVGSPIHEIPFLSDSTVRTFHLWDECFRCFASCLSCDTC